MGLIYKNKKRIEKVLRFLNKKPGFSSIFYWIHELNKDDFLGDRFTAVETREGFMLGVYNHYKDKFWRKIITGKFEPEETHLIKKLVPHFDVFIDIGANIGYYACLVGAKSKDKQLIMFEPFPQNIKILEKNLSMNGLGNNKVHKIALGEKAGSTTLYGVDTMATILANTYAETPSEQVTVKVETLDSFIPEIKPNSNVLLKMDVEGNEYFVLQGAKDFLKNVRPIGLIIEVCKNWSGGENPHYEDTFNLLKGYGYVPYAIEPENKLVLVDNPHNNLTGNYFFIRKDKVNEFINLS